MVLQSTKCQLKWHFLEADSTILSKGKLLGFSMWFLILVLHSNHSYKLHHFCR